MSKSIWSWLSAKFVPGHRRSLEARADLASAYQHVFTGTATREQAQIVLTDLMNFSGWQRVNGHGISPDDRAVSDGMRAVYGRIHRFLRMTEEERSALETAARHEALVDNEEGYI